MHNNGNFYKDIIDNLYDGVYFVNTERVITYWNKGAERITGYESEDVIGRSCSDNMLNHVTANGIQLCQVSCPLAACMEDGNVREADVFLHHADGHRVPVLVRAAPLHNERGNIIGAVETFSSDLGVLAVRQELHELRRSVQTDPLTGIGNRQYLDGRLSAILAELEHHESALAGLLFMDVDHFKHFNDRYGHEVGDKVLRMVASTLRHSLRKPDVVGRWGGEEFLAILYDLDSAEELEQTAEKLRMLVEFSHLDLQADKLKVTISVGATLFLPGDSSDVIVNRADSLMYRSKSAGRNQVCVG